MGGTLFAQIQVRATCSPERSQHEFKGQRGEVGRRKIGLTLTERSSHFGKDKKGVKDRKLKAEVMWRRRRREEWRREAGMITTCNNSPENRKGEFHQVSP